ncbi:MAG: endonuclease MutS2 [Eubacteriales bacterium]|nr:endonuclease MutS2 [Eubacteriales bacterium]
MNQRSLHVLEYNKIIDLLTDRAHTEPGRHLCQALQPMTELAAARDAQSETDDAVSWLLKRGSLPFSGVSDLRPVLALARTGSVLTCAALMQTGQFLRAISRLRGQLPADQWPGLRIGQLIEALTPLRGLEKRLDDAIAGEDELYDTASPQLAQLRRRIRTAQGDVKENLNRILRSHGRILQDQLVTMRGSRYVVPLKAEHRGELPGIVHDTSASGATLFVEPLPVVELNNRIREIMGLEREEIERILQELSAWVTEVADEIARNLELVARLDFAMAKGQLALAMRAMPPVLNDQGRIRLKAARHPLIPADHVVPIDLELGIRFRTLVITGPNTGGKTVSLKTCGLFSLMAMAGLQIPAAEGSEVSVFRQILADIGDEQSIEQDLSTFSSHMRHIVEITDAAGPGVLVLVDELGSGTDPSEGAALAMAVLDHLRRHDCLTVATTHYKELKAYALRTDQVENACCEFDTDTLQPTYRLLIGVPGVSNAFVISRRLGLSETIIGQARQLLSEEGIRFEELISAVEQQTRATGRLREEAEQIRLQLETDKEQLARDRRDLARQKKQVIQKAREEAREAWQSAQDEIDSLMQDIRSKIREDQLAESERLAGQIRQQIRTGLNQVESEIGRETLRVDGQPIDQQYLQPGLEVVAPALGIRGKIAGRPDSRGQCLVMSEDGVQINVPAAALRFAGEHSNETEPGRAGRRSRRRQVMKSTDRLSMQRHQTSSSEIKLLGQTVEEALQTLDKYLDDAVLAGIGSIRIVHGKGTGALRQAVQQKLRSDSRVKTFRLGTYGEGDSGVTLADLK